MFSAIKALLGGAAYSSNPVATGATHLKQLLKKRGLPIETYSDELFNELAGYAHTFSQQMAMMSSRDKPITYFVEHIEYIANVVDLAASGGVPEVAEPLFEILARHGIRSRTI